jgi:hypothetical protein
MGLRQIMEIRMEISDNGNEKLNSQLLFYSHLLFELPSTRAKATKSLDQSLSHSISPF